MRQTALHQIMVRDVLEGRYFMFKIAGMPILRVCMGGSHHFRGVKRNFQTLLIGFFCQWSSLTFNTQVTQVVIRDFDRLQGYEFYRKCQNLA
jgi:hypothetical protein